MKRFTLGQTLANKRVARKLSQKQLALALGYGSGQFVSNWERGLCNPPTKDLRKLALVLKINKAELASLLVGQYTSNVLRTLGGVRVNEKTSR